MGKPKNFLNSVIPQEVYQLLLLALYVYIN